MKVTHLHNRNGNKVKNQFVVYDDSDNKFFQSYDTIIVMEENFIEGPRKIYLDEKYWDYSVTTSKYRNIFLEESSKETAKKIKDGTYILTNLNQKGNKMSDDLWDKKYQALTAMIDRLLEEKDDLSATLRNAEEKYEEAKYKFSDCMHCIKQIKQEKQQMRMDLR